MRNPLVASVYERWWRPAFTAALGLGSMAGQQREALRGLGFESAEPPHRVLDVACGPGNFTRVFANVLPAGGLVVGLDASRPMLARAIADNAVPGAAYLLADARYLPFADGTFDALCCYAALYLVPEPFTVLAEMVRVLAPGGRVALLTSCRSDWEPARTAQTALGWAGGLRMFDRDELTGVLRSAGLVDIERRVSGIAQFVTARRPVG
jgi:ubiquinone/menaquinone biosynthesis C-methylase UbiE